MTTKQEMIKIIKAESPTLRLGNDDSGYTELSADEYETKIAEWADARLAKEAEAAEAEAKAQAKAAAQAKLAALGLTVEDLQALGL
jgi:hypothetical protein